MSDLSTTNQEFKDIFSSEKLIIEVDKVKTDFYTSSGVDIDAGDGFSAVAGRISKSSFTNSPFVEIVDYSEGNFRGPKGFRIKLDLLPEGIDGTLAPDGVGTKVILIDTVGGHVNAAQDVVSMTGDDIARYGGMPLIFTNVLDARSISEDEVAFIRMMEGLGDVAKKQGFVILNGETAELPGCVSSTNPKAKTAFNWSGMMYGVYHKDMMITASNLEPGHILVAFAQAGFRSNGISAVRKSFQLKYGENWYEKAPKQEIKEAASPSIPYARIISEANGWFNNGNKLINITGVCHLSGGSFKGKLLEDMLLEKGLSARFDNLFPIPKIVQKCAIWSQLGDKKIGSLEELYSTWCCGQGMIVAVSNIDEAEKIIELAAKFEVEAKVAGSIQESENDDSKVVIERIKLE